MGSVYSKLFVTIMESAIAHGAEVISDLEGPFLFEQGGLEVAIAGKTAREHLGHQIPPSSAVIFRGGEPIAVIEAGGGTLIGEESEDDLIAIFNRAPNGGTP